MDESTSFELGGVRFTAKSVSQRDGNRVVVNAPRESIRRLSLQHGFVCERPLAQGVFGAVILALGIWPLVRLVNWFFFGGTFDIIEGGMIVFLVFGGWAVVNSIKRGFFILLELDRDKRKLAFSPAPDLDELNTFLADARSSLDYDVEEYSGGGFPGE